MSEPRLLLADEQPMMRSSLRRVLEDGGFTVIAEAESAERAVAMAEAESPAVCLIEVRLPGGGIRAVREMAERAPATAAIMLTDSDEVDDLFDAIRAGARGYLLKDMDPARLPIAIRGVLDGEAAIPRSLVAALVRELHSRGRKRAVVGRHGQTDLTAREWEVLDLLSQRLSTRAIADRLFLSPVTVRRHLSSVIRKLGVEDREEALRVLAETASHRAGDGR